MIQPSMSRAPAGRILVVDDETAQMRALCNTLQDRGYETTGFEAADRALATVEPGRFELLLTDLNMPGMDGIELLRAARQIDEDLVGVLMTGYGTIDSAVEAMKAGAVDYILKPFKLNVVLSVLGRALALRQLRRDNADLSRRLEARTRELEAANRELEAFSHSVAHDLRAPLRSIDGFVQILLEEHSAALPEDTMDLLRPVAAAARRMNRLIDDLLRLARTGLQPLVRRPVDMESLVRRVMAELEPEESGRTVRWIVGDLPRCVGDEGLLRQVIVNLLSNALKFTRQRPQAVIEISARNDGEECVFLVRDNGAGFDMRFAQNLFGAFQRMHRADEFEGTGVGLSLVQRILARHGGRIWAEAEVDRGASFFFVLPVGVESPLEEPERLVE